MSYISFAELGRGLDGYIDEVSPYVVDGLQTMFSSLPLELRENIYLNLLPVHVRSIKPHNNVKGDILYDHRYNIFATSHATSLDVGLWYLRTREFELSSVASCACFAQYLEWFPGEQGFQSIRHLEMCTFWAHPDVDFILRCTNVRTLKLWFDERSFMSSSEWRKLVGDLATAQEVASIFGLARLFGFENLDRIDLKWHRPWEDAAGYAYEGWQLGHGEDFAHGMAGLKGWLVDGFAATGRPVLVGLVPV